MSSLLYVPHHERWWLASQADMPWLTDPDAEDGRQRHHDRDWMRWEKIGTIVAGVFAAVGAGQYELVDGGLDNGPIFAAVDVNLTGLTLPERSIVKSWFAADEAPAGDPWDDGLVNGRHRLWNTWAAAASLTLPVYSAFLQSADDIPLMDAEFGAYMVGAAGEHLAELAPELAARSPLFARTLRELSERAA